jgi:lycopene cyclase domain-containing protein
MSSYLLIDLAIMGVPLALSFDRRVGYYRKWPAVLGAIFITAALYVPWDVLKTAAGVWGFDSRYAGSFRLLGLPPGELLFFAVVPFAGLFIYEVVRAYTREKTFALPRLLWLALAATLVLGALVFRRQLYTLTVLVAAGAFLLLAALLQPEVLGSRHFWLALLITYVPFLLFNGLLTALPVVVYDNTENWGLRVYTIPLEDFFYSFSLLGFNLLVYLPLRRRLVGSRETGAGGRP